MGPNSVVTFWCQAFKPLLLNKHQHVNVLMIIPCATYVVHEFAEAQIIFASANARNGNTHMSSLCLQKNNGPPPSFSKVPCILSLGSARNVCLPVHLLYLFLGTQNLPRGGISRETFLGRQSLQLPFKGTPSVP